MLIGYIGYNLVRGNLPVALPLLSEKFGYTNTQLGYILTISELCYAIGKFTMGPYADVIGGKKMFVWGLAGAVAMNFIFPLYGNLVYFTLVWCAARYFLSMGWGGLAKIIGQWYEPERNGTIMGIISINFQIGGSLSSIFPGLLIMAGVGWRGLFFWPAVISMMIAIWAQLAAKESPQHVIPRVRFGRAASSTRAQLQISNRQPGGWQITKSLLNLQVFRELLVYSFFIHILRSFFMYWIPKFMVDVGMGHAGAAMSSAVFPLAGSLGTVALGWYTDRYTPHHRTSPMWKLLMLATLAIVVIAPLSAYQLKYSWLIVILFAVAGFCVYGPYSMSAGALTLDIAGPEAAGTSTGLLDGVGYIGGTVGSFATGLVADHFGWMYVFYLLSGCGLITASWVLFMSRRRV